MESEKRISRFLHSILYRLSDKVLSLISLPLPPSFIGIVDKLPDQDSPRTSPPSQEGRDRDRGSAGSFHSQSVNLWGQGILQPVPSIGSRILQSQKATTWLSPASNEDSSPNRAGQDLFCALERSMFSSLLVIVKQLRTPFVLMERVLS